MIAKKKARLFSDMVEPNLGRLNTNIPQYDPLKPEPFHKAMEKLRQKLIKANL